MGTTTVDTAMATRLRSLLLQLALHQDEMAAEEAAATPYWVSTPDTVVGHRTAALVLRAEADLVLAKLRRAL